MAVLIWVVLPHNKTLERHTKIYVRKVILITKNMKKVLKKRFIVKQMLRQNLSENEYQLHFFKQIYTEKN